jgi:Nitrile hydratase, alpha chain
MADAFGLSGAQVEESSKAFGKVISQAWADPSYKARLLADPASVLAESGVALPPGVEIRAVENTASVVYLALPAKPSEELSDDALEAVAGGSTAGSAGTVGTLGSALSCLGTASTLGSAGSAGG